MKITADFQEKLEELIEKEFIAQITNDLTSNAVQSAIDDKLKETIKYCFSEQYFCFTESGEISIQCEFRRKIYKCNYKLSEEVDSLLEEAEEYRERLIDIAENFEALAAKIRAVVFR